MFRNAIGLPNYSHSPTLSAIEVHRLYETLVDIRNTTGQWLFRACSTAAHEVSHLFGIDHCDKYSYVMQDGNAFSEWRRCFDTDTPWLCPIDLRKLEWALTSLAQTSSPMALSVFGDTLYVCHYNRMQRYVALRHICKQRLDVRAFAAYYACLDAVIKNMGGKLGNHGVLGQSISLDERWTVHFWQEWGENESEVALTAKRR